MILQRLKSQSAISVEELHREFGVSEVTIRKDLNALDERNLLIRTRYSRRESRIIELERYPLRY